MDWTPYAVGGATRPDSFTRLNPLFAERVYQMTQDAHAAGIPLQITSAYRSPELQAQLYQNALAKYGNEAEARKWVAPAGHSQHNHGTAVDFAIDGSLIRDADSAAARWIAENAKNYGLDVPMGWEPWQVELAGARSGHVAPTQGQNALAAQKPRTKQENALMALSMLGGNSPMFNQAKNALRMSYFLENERS